MSVDRTPPVDQAGRRRRRARWGAVLAALGLLISGGGYLLSAPERPAFTARAERGTVAMRLVETGVLRPAQLLTYRSPLVGTEAEILFIAPEGTRVNEGDLLVRLDTLEVERELERAQQAERAARLDLQVAEAEIADANGEVESVTSGARAIEVDEAQAKLRFAERRLERLRQEYDGLKPLLEKGYLTREELDRSGLELEQAESEIAVARQRARVLVERTFPRDRQKAEMQLAQRQVRLQQVRERVRDASRQAGAFRAALEACSLYARRPGLVVYDDLLSAQPRRKVRVGDRVTSSQGIVTIPEVSQMVVESSVREADVHFVRAGQRAEIRIDALPDLRLEGRVTSIGTLARSSVERPGTDKRFELRIDVAPQSHRDTLRPEMTARVGILVDERSDVLRLPVTAIFEERGRSVVQVLGRWRLQRRQVETGLSNEVYVEIRSGVREGEVVSLVEPTATSGSREPGYPAGGAGTPVPAVRTP